MPTRTKQELLDKLHQAESRFECAIQASSEMFYEWNAETDEVFMAGPVKQYLGVEAHTITTLQDWVQFIHPDDVIRFEEEVQLLAITKDHANMHYRIVSSDGTILEVEDRGFFSVDAHGNLVRMVGFVRDLTEQKRKDQILHRVQRNEMVGRMLTGVSHDLANMTQAIMSATREARYLCECEQAHEILFGIEAAAKQGGSMLRRLNRVAKSGDEQLQSMYLKDVLLDWLEVFKPLLPARIQISLDICDSNVAIQGNPAQIEQLIANLCMNAVDAMPAGGTISLSTQQVIASEGLEAVPTMRLRVEDDGEGLPDVETKQLFAPFFTTKNPENGTGLGLWIVQQVVDNHSADIAVERRAGGGTAFTVDFPIPNAKKRGESFIRELASVIRKRILLVDDDTLLLAGLQAAMKRLGISLSTATSGSAALKKLQSDSQYDIVIMDLDMPVLNGYQVWEKMRRQLPDAHYIFISGSTDKALRELQDLQDHSVLEKPFTIEELIAQIATSIAKGNTS